jgi:hypothetical protein
MKCSIKSSALGFLTKEELVLVIAGFATTMTYVAILLLKHLIYALRSKNWYEIAFNLAIIVYGLIAISLLLIWHRCGSVLETSMDSFYSISIMAFSNLPPS